MEFTFDDGDYGYKYRVNEWVDVQLVSREDGDIVAEIEVDRTSRVIGWFDCIDEVPDFLGYDLKKIKKQDYSIVREQDDLISLNFEDKTFNEQFLYECLAEKGIVPQEKPKNWNADYWVFGYQHCNIFEEGYKVFHEDEDALIYGVEPEELDE